MFPLANGRHFQVSFLEIYIYILIQISPKLVRKEPIKNKSALVQVMTFIPSGNATVYTSLW